MTSKHHNKKENNIRQEISQFDETKVDEIILQVEKDAQEKKSEKEEKIQLAKDEVVAALGGSVKIIGEKISLVLVFVLLLLSIIQSVELFNLRAQIVKGQFTTGASAAPATGTDQGLPSQQGGC